MLYHTNFSQLQKEWYTVWVCVCEQAWECSGTSVPDKIYQWHTSILFALNWHSSHECDVQLFCKFWFKEMANSTSLFVLFWNHSFLEVLMACLIEQLCKNITNFDRNSTGGNVESKCWWCEQKNIITETVLWRQDANTMKWGQPMKWCVCQGLYTFSSTKKQDVGAYLVTRSLVYKQVLICQYKTKRQLMLLQVCEQTHNHRT